MEKKFCFVIGGPGCGKGTQCQKIVQRFAEWEHISIGNLLRRQIELQTTEGVICQQYIDQVQPNSPQEVLAEALKQSSKTKFLIDGYPRDPDQIQAFENSIGDFVCALFFDCSDDVLIERLRDRSLISNRSDDNEKTIEKRLITFRRALHPVLDQLKSRNKLIVIPADGTVDDVFKQTTQTLTKIL